MASRGEPCRGAMARRAGREIWWFIRRGDGKAGGAKAEAIVKDDQEAEG